MQVNKTTQFYQNQLEKYELILKTAKSKVRSLGFARLAMFLIICASIYFLGNEVMLFVVLPIELAGFLFLVHAFLDAKDLRKKVSLIIDLNKNELLTLEGNWSNFPDGFEYKNGAHPFSLDMDLFGPKSLYQLINRTALKAGSNKLASVLSYGSQNIEISNEAIKTFSEQVDWCQNFIIEGQLRVQEGKQRSITELKKIDFPNKIVLVLKWLIPIMSFGTLGLFLANLIPISFLIISLVVVISIVAQFLKSSNKVILPTTGLENEVSAMIRQLELLRIMEVQSQQTKGFIAKLTEGEDSFLAAFASLARIQKRMSYRENILVGTVLNVYFAWDFLFIDLFKTWLEKYSSKLEFWENQLAEVEVWISGGVYHFNFPESNFASFTDGNDFTISELAHPFVNQQKQIKNDINIDSSENFLVITGPNMAGKSTYLRSVGVAILSANAGFPVLAKRCVIPKVELYSSMRTSDDLTVESSYFHAELTRLRFIMDAIESGKSTFIILDEILKGTNSKDKEIGSARFLEKLDRLGARGIIATHDLSLTNLSEKNTAFRNVYFDSIISGSELSFDYLVREGVCKNMNASFLLKQMNLVD